jgi:tetratricopeptide (TPR) repeat protein
MNELVKFEANPDRYTKPGSETDRQDLIRIQTTFLNLLNSLVDRNYDTRGIYTTFEIEQEKAEKFGRDYNRVPEGLLIRLTKEKGYVEYKEPDFKYTFTDRKDYHHNFIVTAYYSAYLSRANYLMNYAKFDEAEELLKRAIEVNPNAPEAKQLISKISQLKMQQNIKPE